MYIMLSECRSRGVAFTSLSSLCSPLIPDAKLASAGSSPLASPSYGMHQASKSFYSQIDQGLAPD